MRPFIEWSKYETTSTPCRYFALCENEAVGTVPNPALGLVPCCQRCADRVGVSDELVPFPARK